jgi:predicted nucleic acid-binding protein
VYVLETSVLARLHHPGVRAAVDALPPDELARCALTDLEIGHSSRNGAEWDLTATMLGAFTEIPLTAETVDRARCVQRLLAAAGLGGRKVPDLLIAAAAEHAGATLVHYDRDFELIAGITSQPHQWVVPRGTID